MHPFILHDGLAQEFGLGLKRMFDLPLCIILFLLVFISGVDALCFLDTFSHHLLPVCVCQRF